MRQLREGTLAKGRALEDSSPGSRKRETQGLKTCDYSRAGLWGKQVETLMDVRVQS